MNPQPVPLQTAVLQAQACGDGLPASYSKSNSKTGRPTVAVPAHSVQDFLQKELSLGKLDSMLAYLWFAGAERPALPLLSQLAIGRDIVVCERMDLHLLWENSGKIFVKPVPRFLLDLEFWSEHLTCPARCGCQIPAAVNCGNGGQQMANQEQLACKEKLRKVALGFLYTYACLISYESDFHVANEKRLLPRSADGATIPWADWKKLAREILMRHNRANVHPRFWRAELLLSRLDTIHRFTQLPPFEPYLRSWRNYGSLFLDNIPWLAMTTVFIALVLTAMEVGLATEQLIESLNFRAASYGFTLFAILGLICVCGQVVLASLFNLKKDLQAVTLAPRFILENKLDEEINIREAGAPGFMTLEHGALQAIPIIQRTAKKHLCLCYPGDNNRWTSPFTVSDIGTTYVKIAKAEQRQELVRADIQKLEDDTIFIRLSMETDYWPFFIRNESDVEFIFWQSNPNLDDDGIVVQSDWRPTRYKLPPRTAMPYAWDYPTAKFKEVVFCAFEQERHVKLDEIGLASPLKFTATSDQGKIIAIEVVADEDSLGDFTVILSQAKTHRP
ncbi:hypothetical protein BKA61DRAFT_262723 [Leptodontidium sp. MPI-SDFR-AT-0119]|nr:hypothetical protein BKA61DRAFT_262723 [Leptodontidium sp. MPI-SDFR-AT-0119]